MLGLRSPLGPVALMLCAGVAAPAGAQVVLDPDVNLLGQEAVPDPLLRSEFALDVATRGARSSVLAAGFPTPGSGDWQASVRAIDSDGVLLWDWTSVP